MTQGTKEGIPSHDVGAWNPGNRKRRNAQKQIDDKPENMFRLLTTKVSKKVASHGLAVAGGGMDHNKARRRIHCLENPLERVKFRLEANVVSAARMKNSAESRDEPV